MWSSSSLWLSFSSSFSLISHLTSDWNGVNHQPTIDIFCSSFLLSTCYYHFNWQNSQYSSIRGRKRWNMMTTAEQKRHRHVTQHKCREKKAYASENIHWHLFFSLSQTKWFTWAVLFPDFFPSFVVKFSFYSEKNDTPLTLNPIDFFFSFWFIMFFNGRTLS